MLIASTHSTADHRLANLASATLLLSLVACGGDGPTGPTTPPCPSLTLGGSWHVQGTVLEIDPDVNPDYVPNGLDSTDLMLAIVTSPGDCEAGYSIEGPDLDTHSLVDQPASFLAAAGPGFPDGAFVIDGVYYVPGQDVSVEVNLDILNLPTPTGNGSFTMGIKFKVYPGSVVAAIDENSVGVDDDGDGEIDEPDEHELDDGIDPSAMSICEGRMLLTFTRGQALALEAKDVPAIPVESCFIDTETGVELPGLFVVQPEMGRVLVAIDMSRLGRQEREIRIDALLRTANGFSGVHTGNDLQARAIGILGPDRTVKCQIDFWYGERREWKTLRTPGWASMPVATSTEAQQGASLSSRSDS